MPEVFLQHYDRVNLSLDFPSLSWIIILSSSSVQFELVHFQLLRFMWFFYSKPVLGLMDPNFQTGLTCPRLIVPLGLSNTPVHLHSFLKYRVMITRLMLTNFVQFLSDR